MVYINIYSYEFDSIYYRGYYELKKAKKDECYVEDVLFEGSFSLEEFPQINEWLKLSIATGLIASECRKNNLLPSDIKFVNFDFDGKDLREDLKRLIKQNFNMEFGYWKS